MTTPPSPTLRLAARSLLLAGLLALAPSAHAQEHGILVETFGESEDAVAAAYLWVDTFNEVGDAVAGLEQAAGLHADEMTITLGSYYDEPLPTGDELTRRGLVRVARSGSAAAVRLGDTARITALLGPAESRDRLTAALDRQVAGLQSALRRAADLATEALACDGIPAGAATACGDPVNPAVWLDLRDQIDALSSTLERALDGADSHDADD